VARPNRGIGFEKTNRKARSLPRKSERFLARRLGPPIPRLRGGGGGGGGGAGGGARRPPLGIALPIPSNNRPCAGAPPHPALPSPRLNSSGSPTAARQAALSGGVAAQRHNKFLAGRGPGID